MAKFLKLILLAAFTSSTMACATIEGAGEDVESLGEEIQETSRNNQ
ncbi:MAG: entericidin A/B family lipoprotein [Pseudomonadota bacterium]